MTGAHTEKIFSPSVLMSCIHHRADDWCIHHRADDWKKKFPHHFNFPSIKMTRDLFEAILVWFLHISNPDENEENGKDSIWQTLQDQTSVHGHGDCLQSWFSTLPGHLRWWEDGIIKGPHHHEVDKVGQGKAHKMGIQTVCACRLLNRLHLELFCVFRKVSLQQARVWVSLQQWSRILHLFTPRG